MFSAELSSELSHLLETITPEFEDNLRRAFVNEGVRRQSLINRKKEDHHRLDDVLVKIGGTSIELTNVVFVWKPDFRISNLKVNFPMLSVDVQLNLGDIKVESKVEAINRDLLNILPITSSGKVTFTVEGITAEGKVGLAMNEDSFVPKNYDIEYSPKNVHVMVSSYGETGNLVENHQNEKFVGSTLASAFWVEFTETLNRLFLNQLSAVIVEFSITELLEENAEELREHLRHQTMKANRLLDSLLCSAKDFLVAKNRRTVETPSFDMLFKRKPTGGSHGNFRTEYGYISDLSTLTRMQDMSLHEDGDKLIVYGFLKMRDFKYIYDYYRAEYEDTKIEGTIKAAIYSNKIFVKTALLKDRAECSPNLESIQLRLVKDIDIDVSGLGSLSWLNEKIASWFVGTFRNKSVGILESWITDAFNDALHKTDCVALVID